MSDDLPAYCHDCARDGVAIPKYPCRHVRPKFTVPAIKPCYAPHGEPRYCVGCDKPHYYFINVTASGLALCGKCCDRWLAAQRRLTV